MGFRFQKRIKLMPGVTLNLSKSGVSTSFGVRGARITRGHGKTRVTVGVPGSGLSHSSVVSSKRRKRAALAPVAHVEEGAPAPGFSRLAKVAGFAVLIFFGLMLGAMLLGM